MSFTYGVNKTRNGIYLAFSTYISPTCNGQVKYVSFSSFLDSLWPFNTKPYSFHLRLSRTFFFHRTTTKSFLSKPIFFGAPRLLHCSYKCMQKAGLVSSFPCPLKFLVAFASCLCTPPCWLKANLKECYTGHFFFFIFSYPLNTRVFTRKLFFFRYQSK